MSAGGCGGSDDGSSVLGSVSGGRAMAGVAAACVRLLGARVRALNAPLLAQEAARRPVLSPPGCRGGQDRRAADTAQVRAC